MSYDEEEKWEKGPTWAWVVWVLGTLGVFAALEWRGLRKEGDGVPPLTHVLRRYVPAWTLFLAGGAFVGWFGWHMAATYLGF